MKGWRAMHIRRSIILIMAAVLTMGGCSSYMKEEEAPAAPAEQSRSQADKEEPQEAKEQKDTGEESPKEIYVYICGAVNKPGVYRMNPGARLYELIDKAGGLGREASETWLNQALELKDGQKIEVPTKKEALKLNKESGAGKADASGEAEEAGSEQEGGSGKVNLNTATKDELMTLSGIGEAKAAAIMAYREEHGGFRKIEDIKQIEGIKDGVFRKIESMITVNE